MQNCIENCHTFNSNDFKNVCTVQKGKQMDYFDRLHIQTAGNIPAHY